MIRPSLLVHADLCGLVAKLAEEYPEASEFTARGNVVDEQNTAALVKGAAPTDADARACVDWFHRTFTDATPMVQERVSLHDPDTGEMLTEGTPDVQVLSEDGEELVTVDWKKREQFFAGNLPGPDDNLQAHAYSLAKALEVGAQRYRNVLVLFGDGEARPLESAVYERADWWPFIDRIRAIQDKERVATPGSHCVSCYSRAVCPSNRERTALALTLLPKGDVGKLTDAQAGELVLRAKMVREAADLAMDLAKAHFNGGGSVTDGHGKAWRPLMMPGRRTADVDALEAAGLTQYVRKGEPYPQWRWGKDKRP